MNYLCSIIAISLFGDPAEQPAEQRRSDADSIQYILDNFHELYSQGLEEAIDLAVWAIDVSRTNSWKEKEAYALMSYGIATYLRGDYQKTLPAFQRSSDLFDSLGIDEGIGRINNEFAVYYRKQKDYKMVYACLDKGEKAALSVNDLSTLSTNYHHRGESFSQKGNFDTALPYFQKVLDIRIQLQDSVGLGYIYLDFAACKAEKGHLEAALEYIEKSTAIRKSLGDNSGIAVNTVIIGETYFAFEDYERAATYFQRTIELAKPIGFTDLARFAYDLLQKSQIELKNFEAAYQNLVSAQALNDSLFNIEKTKTLAEMEAKYQTAKKVQQIELQEAQLTSQSAALLVDRLYIGGLFMVIVGMLIIGYLQYNRMLLKRAKLLEEQKSKTKEAQIKAAISSQESERSRFARDLHDGFGQMISILNLNLKSLQNNTADRQEIFDKSAAVLEEMYQELKGICFNLMPQTLIKHGVKSAIQEFASRINISKKVFIETSFFGMDERLSDLQEISLYRISQEWVNNILKYSDADKITIQLIRDEEGLTLMVEDNGQGFDPDILISGTGNGWKNMNSRCNLIKGELELDTTPGMKGSTLILNAPAVLAHTEEGVQIPV
ncbi:MAG: two-component system NarL family sensor kinase [Marinoscillum sp.]|jgi:two-component system NarL family sensor kinase